MKMSTQQLEENFMVYVNTLCKGRAKSLGEQNIKSRGVCRHKLAGKRNVNFWKIPNKYIDIF
jgi:hypothetical protein